MNISLFLPELTLIIMVLVLFFLSLGKPGPRLLQRTALVMAALSIVMAVASFGTKGMLFFSTYQVDAFSQLFKFILTVGLFVVIGLGAGLKGIDSNLKPEYLMFLTLSVLGLVFLSSAVELLTILLSLEISSFALYVVIPFRKSGEHRKPMEAGIKYVLFGAISTGVTLYGMGYIYGITHTTYLAELVNVVPALIGKEPLLIIGMVMILGSFFYKLALFPMHFWAPDVYEGAANETSSFVATLPKVGAVALLIRLIGLAGPELGQFNWLLAVFAVFSMTLGNLSALVQEDIKRLLAYSSIAHAGYMMVAILCVNQLGFASAIYYIAGYLLMNLACFYVIYNVAANGENIRFDDLKGLYKRAPLLAMTLAVGALGMAGIPPTVGFFGKFFIFTAAIEKSMYALVIITVINAGISAFYYLKMVRAAYSSYEGDVPSIRINLSTSLLGIFFITSILAVGMFPQFFMEIADTAVGTIIHSL